MINIRISWIHSLTSTTDRMKQTTGKRKLNSGSTDCRRDSLNGD